MKIQTLIRRHHLVLLLTLLGSAVRLSSAEPAAEAKLAPALEPLRPFIGKTWKGLFKGSTPEKPKYDVSRWERALNGQAIRITHSVEDGAYGGETIVAFNREAKELQYYYFTTAGFMTKGVFSIEGKKITTVEKVTGNDNGITEVKATTELFPDGSMKTKSRYLKSGEWVDGHEITYHEAPEAKVNFR